ncbi:MAG TPA: HAMP domain-containing sensor histidine kinase [Candidatus Baltobacteraceae bacterium]|nr:HAMP domain-containing sensor histidine kinase [Candidatus Baltobacteraceae bacterium]
MNSLKWRIAVWYAALLIAVLAATSGIVVWRLQGILYDQAKSSVSATMHSIVQFSQQANPFSFEDTSAGTLQFLFNSNNLANWSSLNSFVQVDSKAGYPLSKTSNLGGATIPPNPSLDAKHDVAFREVAIDGRPFLVEDRFVREGNEAAIIHVAEPLDALDKTFSRAVRAIALTLGAAAVAVVLFSIVLASQATTPINELSEEMRAIGSEGLERRLEWRHRRNDEIGRLAESFNDLLQRLAEAFARERQFISDASHELKTPLTSINANAQMLVRWGDRDPTIRRESLDTIVAESAALAGMVNGMLTLAKADRGDEIPKEPVALAQIASEVVHAARPRAVEKGLALHFEHAATPTVYGDPGLLRQLVSNLIDNAVKFTEKGQVDVRVGATERTAWLEVADSGPGIPEAELPHVFDRFYRADKARSRVVPGTGLGLAIVRSIARVHDGDVTAGRSPSGGALFRVTLPRMQLAITDSS